MKQGYGMQIYFLVLLLIGLTGTVISDAWPIRMVCAVLTAVFAYAYVRLEVSRLKEQAAYKLERQRQESHMEMLQTFNHIRHDWMNDIQVLSGYIQLKKVDNLTPYMEKIKVKMQQESFLSKLGIPSLVAYLLAFRGHSRSMQLEVGLDQEINLRQLPVNPHLVTDLIRVVVEMFKEHAASEGQEEAGLLSLEFDVGEDHLLLDFVYQGRYNQEGLERVVREKLLRDSGDFVTDQHDFQEEEAVIALRLPYRT